MQFVEPRSSSGTNPKCAMPRVGRSQAFAERLRYRPVRVEGIPVGPSRPVDLCSHRRPLPDTLHLIPGTCLARRLRMR